jgi:hypothetical protein
MAGHRICGIALAVAFAIVCAAPPALAEPFDGNWKVLAWTTRGHCDGTQFALVIIHGQITSAGGSYYNGYPARFSGEVSPAGYVRLNAMAGPRSAHGTGLLRFYDGEGVWTGRGPSGVCSGEWSAQRF